MNVKAAVGASAEMYLKSIFDLSSGDTTVPISTVADRLGISAVSATEMVHRLQERGLLVHTPYKGVRLTQEGRQGALDVIRRHRLWERFLVDELNLPWEEVHDLACEMEHAAGVKVTEALGAYLSQPTTCPHGNPIPRPSPVKSIQSSDYEQLDRLKIGQSGIVRLINPETTDVLRLLSDRGLVPGSTVHVEEIEPMDGPRTISLGEGQTTLGRELAACIMVEITDSIQADKPEG